MSLYHPGCVEDFERGLTGGDDGGVGKSNPLALVLTEELVADGPISSSFFRQPGWICRAISGGSPSARLFMIHLRCVAELIVILEPTDPRVQRPETVWTRAFPTDLAIEVTLSPRLRTSNVPARRGSRPMAEHQVTSFTLLSCKVLQIQKTRRIAPTACSARI